MATHFKKPKHTSYDGHYHNKNLTHNCPRKDNKLADDLSRPPDDEEAAVDYDEARTIPPVNRSISGAHGANSARTNPKTPRSGDLDGDI